MRIDSLEVEVIFCFDKQSVEVSCKLSDLFARKVNYKDLLESVEDYDLAAPSMKSRTFIFETRLKQESTETSSMKNARPSFVVVRNKKVTLRCNLISEYRQGNKSIFTLNLMLKSCKYEDLLLVLKKMLRGFNDRHAAFVCSVIIEFLISDSIVYKLIEQ